MDLFSAVDSEPIRHEMEQLADRIDQLNYEYYMNDRSLVSDQEFDAMLRRLQDLETQYPDLASPPSAWAARSTRASAKWSTVSPCSRSATPTL